jgi:hypothetical protein
MPRSPAARQADAFKWRNPPIRARGPRELQHILRASNAETHREIPRPESYIGTRVDGPSLRLVLQNVNEPEWRCFWGLVTLGLLPDEPEGFEYQGAVGGGHRLGGTAPDFMMPGLDLAVYMMGLHWHAGLGTAKSGLDALTFARLANQGITAIAVDESDAMERPRGVMAAALRYEDWSIMKRS